MEQDNRKVLRTKEKLLRALCYLINRVSLPEITVAELCRQAHVSRASFYRHYTIPQDVLTEYFGDLFAKAVKVESEIPEPAVIEQTLLQFCRAYYQHQQLFRSMLLSPQDITGLIRNILAGQDLVVKLDSFNVYPFIAGGVASVVAQWAMQDFGDPPEKIAAILTGYIRCLLQATSN